MLFDAEAARVDIKGERAKGESPPGEPLPRASEREDEKLGDDIADGEGRVAQGEELVGTGEDDNEDGGEEPGAECWTVSGPGEGVGLYPWEADLLLQGILGSSVLGTHAATSGTVGTYVSTVMLHDVLRLQNLQGD